MLLVRRTGTRRACFASRATTLSLIKPTTKDMVEPAEELASRYEECEEAEITGREGDKGTSVKRRNHVLQAMNNKEVEQWREPKKWKHHMLIRR